MDLNVLNISRHIINAHRNPVLKFNLKKYREGVRVSRGLPCEPPTLIQRVLYINIILIGHLNYSKNSAANLFSVVKLTCITQTS